MEEAGHWKESLKSVSCPGPFLPLPCSNPQWCKKLLPHAYRHNTLPHHGPRINGANDYRVQYLKLWAKISNYLGCSQIFVTGMEDVTLQKLGPQSEMLFNLISLGLVNVCSSQFTSNISLRWSSLIHSWSQKQVKSLSDILMVCHFFLSIHLLQLQFYISVIIW